MNTDTPGPDPSPRRPTYRLPPHSCDAHCHIFGPVGRFSYSTRRPYTPPEAPLPLLRALHDRIGVERAVLVNATTYGCDNSVIVDAIAQSDGRYRGIGNVDERMTDRELETLASAGIDGCRFTFLTRVGGGPDIDAVQRIAARIAPLGWHLDLYLDATSLDEFVPRLEALPVPYVIDHMGVVDASAGLEQSAFRTLLSLVARDRKCWVKITGPERLSRIGPPFHDAVPFARRLIETAPDRVLWGTDWPHPNVPFVPNDGDLVDLIPQELQPDRVRDGTRAEPISELHRDGCVNTERRPCRDAWAIRVAGRHEIPPVRRHRLRDRAVGWLPGSVRPVQAVEHVRHSEV